jgi:uroporphyrinogen decarboxylase
MANARHGAKTGRSLMRDEVRAAIHFGGPPRPPRALALWHNADTARALGSGLADLLAAYPDDVVHAGMGIDYWNAPPDDPTYRFAFGGRTKPEGLPIDACPVIDDWSQLDAFLREFPGANRRPAIEAVRAIREAHPGRYVLVGWGHYFHQRLAYLRGMQNLLYDFYDAQEQLRVVMDRLLELYRAWAERLGEIGADGVWAGDDLGTQRSLFMSAEVFRQLYRPYYRALADMLHANGLDFWLHTCGNVTELMDDLIDCGVDAIHPIQAGTMDDQTIAERYGGMICFWIGMDVQQVIPFGTPDEVREAVRQRIRTFHRPDGGLILAAGNAILPDTPIANLHAYLETLCEAGEA